MDELDEAQMIAAVRQAAADAHDPTQRKRLSMAAAFFNALQRTDAREREVWAIVNRLAALSDDEITDHELVQRARQLLGTF